MSWSGLGPDRTADLKADSCGADSRGTLGLRIPGGLHLVGTNFSSATPQSRGGSVHLRSRQAGSDPGAGTRTSEMVTVAGTVPARMVC